MAADTTLDKAISDAAASLNKETKTEDSSGEETSSAETTETQEEETSEETEESSEESDSEELSEEETKESQTLYKLLKNPNTRTAVLAALASKEGLLPSQGEKLTKKEETAAKRGIKEILKDKMGSNYDFLSDKLADAFEEILQEERASSETRFQELQRTNVEKEVVANYDRLARETKGESRKMEARMAQLAEEIPIGSMDVRTYLNRLYAIASGEKRQAPVAKTTDQIRKNAGDVSSRLKTGASPLSDASIPNKKMSIDESIKWAQEQLNKGKK